MQAGIDASLRGEGRCSKQISQTAGLAQMGRLHDSEVLKTLRAEHARLSACAAQARGRGEWMLAAKTAAQIVAVEVEIHNALRLRVVPATGTVQQQLSAA